MPKIAATMPKGRVAKRASRAGVPSATNGASDGASATTSAGTRGKRRISIRIGKNTLSHANRPGA